MSPQVPFSARIRGEHRQIDTDFPDSARNGLLHILYDLIEKDFVDDWGRVARELQRIGRIAPGEYNSSSVPSMRRAQEDALEILRTLPWDRALDFCERLHSHLAQEIGYRNDDGEYFVSKSRIEVQADIAGELQRLFLEEGLAFEFSDGLVRRRGRKHTVDVTSRAEVVLGDPRLRSARKHYDKALQFFRNPTALAQTFTGLYGFRSGGDGVGHGGSDGGTATCEVAEYVLAVSASQVIYLVDLANSQETDIPF